jgi:hypothetical protein
MLGYEHYTRRHEAAGFANAANGVPGLAANGQFVDVGFDTLLVASEDLEANTEVFVYYNP